MWQIQSDDAGPQTREHRCSMEQLINHLHIYDLSHTHTVKMLEPPDGGPLVLMDLVYSLELKEYLARVLMVCWKHALQEAFPDRQFEFSYATEPEEYGPTITFWQSD